MSKENAVLNELTELKSKFDRVMDKLTLTDMDLTVISAEYGQLKKLVKSRLDELQQAAAMNVDEQNYLLPALREVHLHCVARGNTQNRQTLSDSLGDAQDYLSHYLSQKR
ncbi:hypothetical protein BIY21_19275 [Vibrio ponticus]|uniref:Uncharacterized protein n=1 Tax=Vibrio ponticus TaxID=265668 RepID=A0A090PAG9_9VIBR|nr:hypothetical protein [Vibrio ponticus]OLQ85182.1 hypothetical protein BIY21_19275 [Vibrio ponticus]ROV58102.1 hypothetical protein EGH82_19985 [Vibrio ponticus]GAK85948.1 hypothetical protein JCM19238_3538 [Vibrio ponticus]